MIIWFDNKKQQTVWRIVLVSSMFLIFISHKLFGDDISKIFVGISAIWVFFGSFILRIFGVGK